MFMIEIDFLGVILSLQYIYLNSIEFSRINQFVMKSKAYSEEEDVQGICLHYDIMDSSRNWFACSELI